METPQEAKPFNLVADEKRDINIDVEFEASDAVKMVAAKLAWLDMTMKAILPPSIYADLHSDKGFRWAGAKRYMDREGIAFREQNQCAFITVKETIVARFDSPWRMKNGSKKRQHS